MSDLRGLNTPAEVGAGSTGKIAGAVIIALAIGGIGGLHL